MPFKKVPELYSVWQGIIQRCTNPNYHQHKDYAGRGITVCQRWRSSYADFVADMGPRPPGTVIDRIDNNKGYYPENCRWATRRESQNNRRNTSRVTIEGQTHIAGDLARQSGLKVDTIIERSAKGLSLPEVLSPLRRVFREGLALGGPASGAKRAAATHCKRGHEFTPENTGTQKYANGRTGRECRACRRMRDRERH